MNKKKYSTFIFASVVFASSILLLTSFTQAVAAQGTQGSAQSQKGNSNKNIVSLTEPQVGNNKNNGVKENKGQLTSASHQSTVAAFVQSLLSVADREGGIGEQVRTIAQQQNDSKNKVSDEIDSVENRSKIKTFLIGSDYKNLGALRSEMVKTRNQIDQLKRLVDKATLEEDKSTLQEQINSLEQEQTDISSFVTQHENEFSLFGWAVKLFNK